MKGRPQGMAAMSARRASLTLMGMQRPYRTQTQV